MDVNPVILAARLAEGAIAAIAFALFHDLQWAVDANQKGRQIGEEGGAFSRPRRINQNVVGDHGIPTLNQCREGMVHTAKQHVSDSAGPLSFTEHLMPERRLQIPFRKHKQEGVDSGIQTGRRDQAL